MVDHFYTPGDHFCPLVLSQFTGFESHKNIQKLNHVLPVSRSIIYVIYYIQ